jgi:hypothetical protein
MIQIAILNDIVSTDFITSLDIQQSWGIKVLDLRAHIFGSNVTTLSEEDAHKAAACIVARNMSVYCLSTGIFFNDIELGREQFVEKYEGQIEQTIRNAGILKPSVIRLLSARSSKRSLFPDSSIYMDEQHPWVIPLYQEAVDRFHAAGFRVTIENEVNNCIWSTPGEIISFFEKLDRPGKVSFTFDVQNLWKMGTFPSLSVYRELAPLIGYYHLKGGQSAESGSNELIWKSSLEDASWPVTEMTQQVIAQQQCEAICLNPSHGDVKPGYDYNDLDRRNYEFLKQLVNN